MVGKIHIRRVGGWAPWLDGSIRDAALDAKEARDQRKKDRDQRKKGKGKRADV